MTKYFESNVSHFSSLLSVIASVSACYSETLVRMPTEGQTPSWLISYKISLCYLLSLIAVLSNIHTALNSNETRERERERLRGQTALRQRVRRGWCTWTWLLSPDLASVKNCMLPDFLWIIEIVSEDITRLLRDWCLHHAALLTRMPGAPGSGDKSLQSVPGPGRGESETGLESPSPECLITRIMSPGAGDGHYTLVTPGNGTSGQSRCHASRVNTRIHDNNNGITVACRSSRWPYYLEVGANMD